MKAMQVAALAMCTVARAAQAAPEPVQPEGAWYGYQTLASDAAAFALITTGMLVGGNVDSAALALGLGIPGGALYFGGGPLIHAGHGDGPGAWSSLLRRVLIPLSVGGVGAGIGALTAPVPKRAREVPVPALAISRNGVALGLQLVF